MTDKNTLSQIINGAKSKHEENIKNNLINDNFLCPISLDTYKEPVFIPDCGHTFDRQNLIDLPNKKCPICSIAFSGNPNSFKTNWSLASIMNLNIKNIEVKLEDDLLEYSAKNARDDRLKFVNEIKLTILVQILKQIKSAASQGKTSIEFDFSGTSPDVITIIKQELTKKGFSLADIHMKFNFTRISWS